MKGFLCEAHTKLSHICILRLQEMLYVWNCFGALQTCPQYVRPMLQLCDTTLQEIQAATPGPCLAVHVFSLPVSRCMSRCMSAAHVLRSPVYFYPCMTLSLLSVYSVVCSAIHVSHLMSHYPCVHTLHHASVWRGVCPAICVPRCSYVPLDGLLSVCPCLCASVFDSQRPQSYSPCVWLAVCPDPRIFHWYTWCVPRSTSVYVQICSLLVYCVCPTDLMCHFLNVTYLVYHDFCPTVSCLQSSSTRAQFMFPVSGDTWCPFVP